MDDAISNDALAMHAMQSSRQAVLATHSAHLPGFPFPSVIPIVIDQSGQIVTLLSALAQHSRNINLDPRASILLHDDTAPYWQAASRLSVVGRMEPLEPEDLEDSGIREQFFKLHPELNEFDQNLDFSFWTLKPIRFRLIGGFGRIHWLDKLDSRPLEVDASLREQINQFLTARFGAGQSHAINGYGVQWQQGHRVRFVALAEPVRDVDALMHQLQAGQFSDLRSPA